MKYWWQSKVIWFNIVMAVVELANEMAVVVELLPEEYQASSRIALTVVVAIGNTILRFKTDQGIK